MVGTDPEMLCDVSIRVSKIINLLKLMQFQTACKMSLFLGLCNSDSVDLINRNADKAKGCLSSLAPGQTLHCHY